MIAEKDKFSRYLTAVGFAAVYAFLFFYFKPSLIFSPTTTAGGDTGSHHYIADFLIKSLLPQGRVSGWSMGWFAGFPMLYFYFPLPYLLIALLSVVIKYQVAFKIVTVLGVFLLPLTTYLAFRILKFNFPLPIMAAVFTLPFLFMESYSIYGGNILSTLAGEFGYSLSFALTVLFLALLYRDMEEQKFRITTGILLAAIILSHLIPAIMIVIFSSYFLIGRLNLKRLGILIGVFGVGFLLSAFWAVPFVARMGYTAHMKWDQLKGINELFPVPVRPFLAFSAIGIIGALAKRDIRMNFILWMTVATGLMFFILPNGQLWNGRIVPFFYYFTFVWAAYGVWFLLRFAARLLYNYLFISKRYTEYAIFTITVITVLAGVFYSSQVAATWIKWNYSGYEGKRSWKSLKEINDYISKLPPGRVMWEHSQKTDELGTPRAFELLPYFTGHPSMEGLLMEASFTAPYHFINQAELSKDPSYAIQGVDYPGMNIPDGIRHLKLYNVKYFLALSDEVKREASKDKDLKLLKVFAVRDSDLKYALYEINTQGYVVIPKYEPVLTNTKSWRETSLAWYKNPDLLDVPLIDASKAKLLAGKFPLIGKDIHNLPSVPIETDGHVTDVKITDSEVKFTTTAIGVPHWIKVSYFPNWKVKGADGPYLASPSVMMVIPRQKEVTLYFGNTFFDMLGVMLTAIGVLLAVSYAAIKNFF